MPPFKMREKKEVCECPADILLGADGDGDPGNPKERGKERLT